VNLRETLRGLLWLRADFRLQSNHEGHEGFTKVHEGKST